MNPTSDIKVDRLAVDGDGIGRLAQGGADDGKVAFVPYTIPGETVRGRLLLEKKNLSHWQPVKILQPSPDRATPKCPLHFKPEVSGPWCGGCDWQHMTTAAQRKYKSGILANALERLGGFPSPPVLPLVSAPEDWRYRNKVQVPFAGAPGKVAAGFFAPGSHQIVPFDDCLVQPELSVAIVRFVVKMANAARWAPYDEDSGRGWLRHLLVRTNQRGQAMVTLVTAHESFADKHRFVDMIRKEFPSIIGVTQNVQAGRTHVILGRHWTKLWGADRMEETLPGLKISYSAGAFFQVNTPAAALLYGLAIEKLAPTRETFVADLYCGVGALTLLAAQKCGLAAGVEEVSAAIYDAEENARANNIRNVRFMVSDVGRALSMPGPLTDNLRFGNSGVVLDPPRSGCERPVLEALLRLKPKRIVYVSCHPATLSRDLKLLSAAYRLVSVTPVDLFPQTSHIEAVAQMDLR